MVRTIDSRDPQKRERARKCKWSRCYAVHRISRKETRPYICPPTRRHPCIARRSVAGLTGGRAHEPCRKTPEYSSRRALSTFKPLAYIERARLRHAIYMYAAANEWCLETANARRHARGCLSLQNEIAYRSGESRSSIVDAAASLFLYLSPRPPARRSVLRN